MALYLLLSIYLRMDLGVCAACLFVKHINELSHLNGEESFLLGSGAFFVEARFDFLRDRGVKFYRLVSRKEGELISVYDNGVEAAIVRAKGLP